MKIENLNYKINSFLNNMKISKEEFDDFKNIAEYTNFNLKIMEWFNKVHKIEIIGWRNKKVTQKICDILLNNTEIEFYSLFCPSYKKGIGEVGFRIDDVGDTTKNGIEKLKKLNDITNECGFKTKKPKAIFFDVALEQANKTKYMIEDLKLNIENFKKYITPDIEYAKLSDIFPEIVDIIGYEGVIIDPLPVNDEIFYRVLERGRKFYELFGWTEEQIIHRTKIIVSSESIIGSMIRHRNPNSIMLYTPTMLERAQIYSGKKQEDPLAIIIPKK